MQGKNGLIPEDNGQPDKNGINRRKRINRMKTAIVIIVILLMILPTICCIFLGIQISRLQKQVNDLYSLHGLSELTYEEKKNENYAYAAEKSDIVLDTSELAALALETVNGSSNLDILSQKQDLNLADSITDTEIESDEMSWSFEVVGSDTNIVTDDQDLAKGKVKQVKNSEQASTIDNNDNDNNDNSNNTNSNNTNSNNTNSNNTNSNNTNSNNTNSNNTNSNKANNNEITGLSTSNYKGKKVYLTFDDGPSMYTDDILDILAEHNVKATFFVIGKTDKVSKDLYRRIVEEGHTLGMHSYSHVYEKIYNSIEDFDKDFTKLWKLLYDTTGYKPSIFRFPGGSDNLVNKNGMEEFIQYLKDASTVYFDWNVVSGDATGVEYTKEQLIDNVLNGVEMKRTSIVLMHDSQAKETTVDSLPELLEDLISGGAEILPLDKDIPPIQMIKADTIK